MRQTHWMHKVSRCEQSKFIQHTSISAFKCSEKWIKLQPSMLATLRRWYMDSSHHRSWCSGTSHFESVTNFHCTQERNHRHIPPFTPRNSRGQSGRKVVFYPSIHFPPHLHGDTPALHGRKPVAHVGVAAIWRGLRCVRLRQISPHGCRFLWLFVGREYNTEETPRFSIGYRDTDLVHYSHFNCVYRLG